jgi:hypothetical protein
VALLEVDVDARQRIAGAVPLADEAVVGDQRPQQHDERNTAKGDQDD